MNGRRFNLRALFFVTFLAASWSLGMRLVADVPDAGLLIIGAVAWGSIIAIAAVSALLR